MRGHGGELVRLSVARAEPVGSFSGWRPAMPVTQWAWRKAMTGRLYGIGVGPGDPELMTLKAVRILCAVPVIAYPAPDHRRKRRPRHRRRVHPGGADRDRHPRPHAAGTRCR